jgi:hypothetical protein
MQVERQDIVTLLDMYDKGFNSEFIQDGIGKLVRSAIRQYCPPIPQQSRKPKPPRDTRLD